MLKLITITTLFFTFTLNAKWDYKSVNLIRTYPVGLFTSFDIGHGLKLWGSPNRSSESVSKEKLNPLYGYIRPSLTFQSSGLVNSIRPQLSIYPISFVDLFAGYDYTNRRIKVQTFDCLSTVCRGDVTRFYFGARTALSYKGIFNLTKYQRVHISMIDKLGPFVDERSTLIASSESDYVNHWEVILGKELNSKWAAGWIHLSMSMENYNNNSHMNMAFVRYREKKWDYYLGAGAFSTRLDHDVASLLLIAQWNGAKGLNLF